MQFNLISRISEDKNFFVDLICAIHQVKARHGAVARLTFVGAVETEAIYNTLARLIELLEIGDQVNFTKASIRYADMTAEMKDGYFINFSIGDFVGYSSIEAMSLGLKTFFYNVDESCKEIMQPGWRCFCPDYESLIRLIYDISSGEESVVETLRLENQKLLSNYSLSDSEAELLKSLMI